MSVLYDKIIGKELIDATDIIANCHPGRLPQYRGARPVNSALLKGECLHGATLHVIETGIDTGPILGEVAFSIWPDTDEVRDVWQRTMRHAALLLSDTLPRLDHITPRSQDEALARAIVARHLHGAREALTRLGHTTGPGEIRPGARHMESRCSTTAPHRRHAVAGCGTSRALATFRAITAIRGGR